MSRSLALLTIPARLAAVVSAAPVPKGRVLPVQFYFPTSVGTRWVYQVGGREETERVYAVEERDGSMLVSVAVLGGDSRVVSVSDKGLFQVPSGIPVWPAKPAEPMCLLKLPERADGSCRWEVESDTGPEKYHVRYVALRGETVRVPAGRYHAVRVTAQYVIGGTTREATFWYAPRVGLVKMVSGGTVKELKAFTPGKE
jgi:hypothetical protein